MLLFKASGQTYLGVVAHRRHAFHGKPQTFHRNELVLLSKNRIDCVGPEKQVQYVGKLTDIRKPISADEFELYWPGSHGAGALELRGGIVRNTAIRCSVQPEHDPRARLEAL